ncbi:protein tyrosine kinase [Litchfieldella qijiaojingensis]|uniref:Protein tyrosine kinase n=1 Tax=Litchfieldella qijiaojingensis TaxID=980347 RepID=A0ABQ2Z925_9GAMM|nr:polysaccharide biosynthesis tyrosine autokinase [Halomonas qijiaojingensis]GGY06507.1 protein tyrosine kinase [Halomonas qijiaojingensis]
MTQMPSLPSTPKNNDDEIDFQRLFGLLLDHKWLIVLVTAAFMVGGMIYATLSTPIYQGNALVQVERRSSVSPLGDLATVMGREEQSASAEVEILRSRMVLGKVVDRIELDSVVIPRKLPIIGEYIQRNGIARPNLKTWPVIGSLIERYDSEIPLIDAVNSAVWGGESLQLGRLDVTDKFRGQPFFLRVLEEDRFQLRLNDQIIGEGVVGETTGFLDGGVNLRISKIDAPPMTEFTLIKLHRASAIGSLAARLGVFEQGGERGGGTGMLRLILTGTDREEIRRALDAISQTFLMQNVERQSAQADQSLEFLEEQAPELRAKLSDAEDRLNQYRVKLDSVDLNSEAQSYINQFIEIERQLNELELQESEISQRFTPQHPSYRTLLRQKNHLINEKNRLNELVNEMPAAQQEIVRLTRDVEVTQAIYVNVLNRAQELQLAKAGTIGNVRIIDDALVAGGPIAPNKPILVILSTIVGAVLAVAYVLVKGILNRGVESPEQLEELGLPVYATIPLSEDQLKLVRRIKYQRDKRSSSIIKGILGVVNPTDTAIEALRGLRTSLHFAMLEAKNNCIMITGPSPEIGKSFITINLGTICAQAGLKVLIIDADMRKGHIHNAFRHASEGGLSELLSGELEWQNAIRQTEIDGLFYVSRGKIPPNPSELLMQERFGNFLEGFSPEYDLVLIDTPPILAVTDAAIVGKRVGASLMVARFQLNPPREVSIALRRLETSGVEVKGCILNAMEKKSSVRYGYGYYNYSYH